MSGAAPKSSDDLVCQCTVSYHHENHNGRIVCVLDEGCELPDIMTMAFGLCEKCGLPYHTEFANRDE